MRKFCVWRLGNSRENARYRGGGLFHCIDFPMRWRCNVPERHRALCQSLVGSDLRADRSPKATRRKTRSPRRCDPTCPACSGQAAGDGTENRRKPHQNRQIIQTLERSPRPVPVQFDPIFLPSRFLSGSIARKFHERFGL